MKTLTLVVFILAALVGYTLRPSAQGQVQALQVCGQGIVVRPDGSVLLDGWVTYMSDRAPNAVGAAAITSTTLPTRITIGQAVVDATKVCIEDSDGTTCTTLGAVRKLAGSAALKR
jgi:hypothetical protein